jgi:manganese transport protein
MGRWLLTPDLPGFFHSPDLVVLAIGIIGATVMPHNLYLHSALVQSRQLEGVTIQRAVRYNTIDTVVALTVAFFVNAAILVLAAVVFYGHDKVTLTSGEVLVLNNDADWIQVAYATLAPLLGTAAASLLFAVALLASGQSSTITGTLAGQVVMEGFMHWRIAPWVRRLLTRLCAITPAIILIAVRGNHSINDLMNLSQMVLAIQLPLAMFPLMVFATSKRRMGAHRIGWFLLGTGWASCLLITALDIYGLPDVLRQGILVFTPQ